MTTSPGGADVHVIGPEGRDGRTGQSPGLQRCAVMSARLTGSEQFGMGDAVVEPGGKTGVHHHGESETAIYILTG